MKDFTSFLLSFIEKELDDDFMRAVSDYSKEEPKIDGMRGSDIQFYAYEKSGFDLIEKDGRLDSIHFFSGETRDGERFLSDLPEGLTWSDDQNSVKKKIGNEPFKSQSAIPGKFPWSYDIYDRVHYQLHVEYNPDLTIRLVTAQRKKN